MPNSKPTAPGTEFSFITYDGNPNATDRNLRREARSHVARLQHRNARQRQNQAYAQKERALRFREYNTSAVTARQTPITAEQTNSMEGADGAAADMSVTSQHGATIIDGSSEGHDINEHDDTELILRQRHDCTMPPSSEQIVRASRVARNVSRQHVLQDPADQMASILGRLQLDFPTVMEHYRWIVFTQSLDFEQIFMPELERGTGSETLVSRIARDPALVSAAVLVATGHILAIRNTPTLNKNIARCIYELKSFVLNTVNEALRDPDRATTDPLICAILILASHEGLQGSLENYHIHMRGLVQMINLRGGLSKLNETQKYLEPFIIWQDTNVATIVRCVPYWKQTKNRTKGLPSVAPNPGMWLLTDI